MSISSSPRVARRARGVRALCGACTLLASATLGAQAAPRPDALRPASGDLAPAHERWSLDADYLHVGSGPIHRDAGRSMGATLGFDAARSDASGITWRAEGGWMRAARVNTTAQGATLGTSVGLPVGRGAARGTARLTLRPGVAVLAGWAEAQGAVALYDWRGLPTTTYAGQTGTQTYQQPTRGRTTGAGASLGAELRVSRGLAVTGSVRRWAFTGDVIRPNRLATLGGLGIAVRPATFASEASRWWTRGYRAAVGRSPETVASRASVAAPADSTRAEGGR